MESRFWYFATIARTSAAKSGVDKLRRLKSITILSEMQYIRKIDTG